MNCAEVTLPVGINIEGEWHRGASLHSLSGREEAFISEQAGSVPPAHLVTTLLSTCLDHVGPATPVNTSIVRRLTVGDREALLLHLRRLAFGDRISCVLYCPNDSCREKLDLDLRVSDLLEPGSSRSEEWHETTISDDGFAYRVRFRLPTGADQEAVVDLARLDPFAAAALVLRRCIDRVTVEGETSQPLADLPACVATELPELMANLDPQAYLQLSLTCPVCDQVFTAPFDAAAYFFGELSRQLHSLYQEVHLLAFYYHWSESEIMAMTGHKRRLYLGLLSESLAGRKTR